MDISKIKLVATDMDGTLLDAQKKLPSDFYPMFRQLQSRGILFAAASGRQFYNLQNEFQPIKEEMVFIAENGSYVVSKGKEIFVQEMDKNVVRDLIVTARTIPDAYIILCGKKQAYIENTAPEFMKHVNMYYDRQAVVDDLTKVEGDQFLKIAICDLAGSEQNSYPYFKHLQQALQVKVSGSLWLDLSHKLANKGRAMKVLQQSLNISFNETMVFGDYLNDLEMMSEGYFSYAMENAHPEIKAASRFIAKSNDDGGVMKVLKAMLKEMSLSVE